LSVVVLD